METRAVRPAAKEARATVTAMATTGIIGVAETGQIIAADATKTITGVVTEEEKEEEMELVAPAQEAFKDHKCTLIITMR